MSNKTFFLIDFNNGNIIFTPFLMKNNYLYQKRVLSVYDIYHYDNHNYLLYSLKENNIYIFNNLLNEIFQKFSFNMELLNLEWILNNVVKNITPQKEKENNLMLLTMLYNFSYLRKLNPNYFSQKNIFIYKIKKNVINNTVEVEKNSLNDYLDKFEALLYQYFKFPYFINSTQNLSFWSVYIMAKAYRYHLDKTKSHHFSFFSRIGEKSNNYDLLEEHNFIEFIKNRFFQQIVYLTKFFNDKNDEAFSSLRNKSMITVLINKNISLAETKEILQNYKNAFRSEKNNMKKFILYNNSFDFCFSIFLKNNENKDNMLDFLKSIGIFRSDTINLFVSSKKYLLDKLRVISYVQDLDFLVDIGSFLR